MMMKSLTWQQVAVLALCLGAAFAAHRYMGASEGMAAGVISALIAFLMGRPQDPPPPPPGPPPSSLGGGAPPTDGPSVVKSIGFAASGALLCLTLSAVGCGTPLEAKDPTSILEKCAGEARAAYYVGEVSVEDAMAVYEACKKREGL